MRTFFIALNKKKSPAFLSKKTQGLTSFLSKIFWCVEKTVIICFEHFTCLVQVGRKYCSTKKTSRSVVSFFFSLDLYTIFFLKRVINGFCLCRTVSNFELKWTEFSRLNRRSWRPTCTGACAGRAGANFCTPTCLWCGDCRYWMCTVGSH